MNHKYLTLIALSFSLTACSEHVSEFEKQYIELESLVNRTIETNDKTKPEFNKKVLINGETETVTTTDINWQKELEVFLAMDLNKRDYLNKYKIDSTDRTVRYGLKEGKEAPVKELLVNFDSTYTVSELHALLKTNNFLYDSERNLTLKFNANELASYEVDGWQQLFVGGKKYYGIKAVKK